MKVSFALQQKSFLVRIMNPSPVEIADLFTFVEVTLAQYSTLTGHWPGATAANAKVERKKVNKVEVAPEKPAGQRRKHPKTEK